MVVPSEAMNVHVNPPPDENTRERQSTGLMTRRPTTSITDSTASRRKIPYHLLAPASGATSIRLYSMSTSSDPKDEPVDETKEKAAPTESEEDVAADRSTVAPLHDGNPPAPINTEEITENGLPAQSEEDASAPITIDRTALVSESSLQKTTKTLKATLMSEARPIKSFNLNKRSSLARNGSQPQLTHINQQGEAHMVPIHNKDVTSRTAVAICRVYFSNATTGNLISHNLNRKGDVLGVARVAGIMAAKKCSEIIPLCHPIMLSYVGLDLKVVDKQQWKTQWGSVGQGFDRKLVPVPTREKQETQEKEKKKMKEEDFGWVSVKATVSCDGQTGVEMEALTAASTAALTVYDMCKGVDKGMKIGGLKVLRKEGGKSGTWVDGKKESAIEEKHEIVGVDAKEERQPRVPNRMLRHGFQTGPL
jgi:cyclic pyranopterin phosphate synthase